MALVIDANRCPHSHRCPMIAVCPVEAITQHGLTVPEVDSQKCIECGKCIAVCGMQAAYISDDDYGKTL